jgi:hypothetical protein
MNGIHLTVPWLLVGVQAFGLFSACVARLSEGFACQRITQMVFFAALPLMGVATCAALPAGPGIWLSCTASLALMILTATCELRVDSGIMG